MIKIITPCDSFKHFEVPINEYIKRLGKKVEIIKIRPSKKNNIKDIILEETNMINDKISKEYGFKVLLYITSKYLKSEELVTFIEDKQSNYGNIIFVIGGPYGVNYDMIKDNIDYNLSFSPMTFPHPMAIMILLEQIYRADCIKIGKKYHH